MKQITLLAATVFLFGLSFAQVNEKIDRGVIALAKSQKSVYVGWRLFKTDPADISFNIYRQNIGYGGFEKINKEFYRTKRKHA